MWIDLVDAIASLAKLVDEENDRLTMPINHPDLPGIVAAKSRLAGQVEAETARLAREDPDWLATLDPDDRGKVTALIETLLRRLSINANLLDRRIRLCDDLMGAIAAEAQRLTGARSTVYGVRGTLRLNENPAPISVNGQF
ncbi:flagellar protein FlgN [Sphingomonas mollis]|uniref:Flagellar protein FlgN n=1 Tax=Sphingomonas mollis TaxID=2795726 RepID=A0ABS0XPT0_9SPHN|nr:flagellar protein FlgN [Sphingomonas sp. BT553]MBJ6122051.1 flagellar protein FlgN [Sphingomonas sp. BT553]